MFVVEIMLLLYSIFPGAISLKISGNLEVDTYEFPKNQDFPRIRISQGIFLDDVRIVMTSVSVILPNNAGKPI